MAALDNGLTCLARLRKRQKGLFADYEYMELLLANLNEARKAKSFTDVLVRVGNADFRAHKLVLAASSSVFRAMLSNAMSESIRGEIDLTETGFKSKTIQELLDYIYTGSIEVNARNVEDLLSVATFFMIDSLKRYCCSIVLQNLNTGNCLGIRNLAMNYDCRNLFDEADRLLKREFIDVVFREEFLHSNVEVLCDILSMDDIEVESENDVLQAFLRWNKVNNALPEEKLNKILENIRFQYVSEEAFEELGDAICHDVQDTYAHLRQSQQRLGMQLADWFSVSNRKRNCLERQRVILAVGGYNGRNCLQHVFAYVVDECRWSPVSFMKVARHDFGLDCIEDSVYVVGGFNSNAGPLNSMEVYNAVRNEWLTLKPMNERRKSLSVAVLGGQLYASGGQDMDYSPLSAVECYNPNENAWSYVESMAEARYSHCLVSDERYLYACGGWQLSSLERYDPVTDQWMMLSPMCTPRAGASAVVLDEKILMIGGYGEFGCLQSVEFYDISQEIWILLADASVSRWRAAAAITDKGVIVLGGRDSNWQYLDYSEQFDAEHEKWHKLSPLPAKAMGLRACVTNVPAHHLRY